MREGSERAQARREQRRRGARRLCASARRTASAWATLALLAASCTRVPYTHTHTHTHTHTRELMLAGKQPCALIPAGQSPGD